MSQEMLWFVHVFDDFVKRKKLMSNFSPEDILHCCDGLSEKETEWLKNWISVWNVLNTQEK
tara:strand:- start:76 stop:258 length:183 start_codon:yes stop_codon:yes gene_type:complete